MAETPADTSDEAQVKARKSKATRLREKEIRGMQIFLENPDNQWFIWRILEYCHMGVSVTRSNPQDMAILSAQRDLGLWILSELEEAVPDAYTILKRTSKEYMKAHG